MKIASVVLLFIFLTALSAAAAEQYVIRAGDTLDITVAGEPDLTKKTVVRPDGKVAIGLVGDVKAEGLTPEQFRTSVETALKKYMKRPKVTIEASGYDTAASVNVLGAVQQPGHYPLRGKATVTDALGYAGGTTNRAKIEEVVILRATAAGTQKTVVNLGKMVKTGETTTNLVLQSGDTVYVPQKKERPDWLRLVGAAVSVGYLLSK